MMCCMFRLQTVTSDERPWCRKDSFLRQTVTLDEKRDIWRMDWTKVPFEALPAVHPSWTPAPSGSAGASGSGGPDPRSGGVDPGALGDAAALLPSSAMSGETVALRLAAMGVPITRVEVAPLRRLDCGDTAGWPEFPVVTEIPCYGEQFDPLGGVYGRPGHQPLCVSIGKALLKHVAK